jgi:hypothetical protein
MKLTNPILISIITLSTFGCKQFHSPYCNGLSDSYPITVKKTELTKSIGNNANLDLFFNPLVLPFKIVYSNKKGFSVNFEGQQSIITPIGKVGIEYSFGFSEKSNINGHEITSGDFVVGLSNKNTKEITLYKIQGHNRLKVVTTGKTQIDAQAGYVEIDITNATLQELVFIDISKFSIVNNTNELQKFTLSLKDKTGGITNFSCEVDAHSYKLYPRFDFAKSYNEFHDVEYFINVDNNDVNNNLITTLSRKLTFGDACHINNSSQGLNITIRENSSK